MVSQAAFAPGSPIYATLPGDRGPLGLAAAVRSGCRLSRVERHYYCPAFPALHADVDPAAALESLTHLFRSAGAFEVAFDSFDVRQLPPAVPGARPSRKRHEYLVELAADPEIQLRNFGETHRRHARRGEREGWRLLRPGSERAAEVLALVTEEASSRAARRGAGFDPAALGPGDLTQASLEEPEGLAIFAAEAGNICLSAIRIGWAGRRGYHLMGGSSPEGYRLGAAVWLHWRVMAALVQAGITTYNLGGAPAEAPEVNHPAHGLHRFKSGFGSKMVAGQGFTRTLVPIHGWMHSAAAAARGLFGR